MTSQRSTLSGLLAAGAAIAATEGLSALFNVRESPILAVGQSVIKLTPGPMAEAIIGVVGQADKPLAVASVVVAVLLLGAITGRAWPRPWHMCSWPASSGSGRPRCCLVRMGTPVACLSASQAGAP